MNTSLYSRILIVVFCLVLAVPAVASTPRKGESPEELTQRLLEFGRQIAASYNRTVLGSRDHKKIRKNDDGTYTAIFHEICIDSISGSYKESSNPKGPVRYIGTLTYAEIRHMSAPAPTQAEAKEGPFTQSRTTTTELIKYVRGQWSY